VPLPGSRFHPFVKPLTTPSDSSTVRKASEPGARQKRKTRGNQTAWKDGNVHRIHIDLETRSACDLKKSGPHRYAQHESTKVLCVAWAVDDGNPDIWFPTIPGNESQRKMCDLFALVEAGNELHAFNASFESSIWSEQLVPKFGAPPVADGQWHCTQAQARAVSLTASLDGVAKILGLREQKDLAGHDLMKKICVLKPGAYQTEFECTARADLERLGEYCKQDVIVEREVSKQLPPLSAHEHKIFTVDQKINKRGAPIDLGFVRSAIEVFDLCQVEANAELVDITRGKIHTTNQTGTIQKFAMARGVPMSGCTKDDVEAALKLDDIDPVVRRVLELRQSLGRAAVKKYPAIIAGVCEDNRIRDHLAYSGAGRTRRWSGQRFQTQNIARGFSDTEKIEIAINMIMDRSVGGLSFTFGDPVDALASVVRSSILAEDGKILIVCDYSSIEARVLAVVAKNEPLLEDFRRGRDPYKTMGSRIFKVPYEQIGKDSEERFFGKQAILGLGYGMGAKKFAETCEKYRHPISLEFAQNVVDIYRSTNPTVKRFWKWIEGQALETIRDRRENSMFRWDDLLSALVLKLPNGSERWYINARIDQVEKFGKPAQAITYEEIDSETRKWKRTSTYGGKLTENYVQSTARELQADAILAVDALGWPIVMHTHDEIVVEVPIGSVSERDLESAMCNASPWASHWPIGAKADIMERYKK